MSKLIKKKKQFFFRNVNMYWNRYNKWFWIHNNKKIHPVYLNVTLVYIEFIYTTDL